MYLNESTQDIQDMLSTIGESSVESLFHAIPQKLRFDRELDIPGPFSEIELTHHMQLLADTNGSPRHMPCFLGGGSYDHFVPAVVDHVASRSEFYTSYTPYQAEVSQGNLQATFEYQTLICQLTGMEVSNASLYEGGSACAEAVLMAMSQTRRYEKVAVLATVNPEYRDIIRTYVHGLKTELFEVPWGPSGHALPETAEAVLDEQTACLVIQHPNFFGGLEQVTELAEIAHAKGIQIVHVFDPISLGVLSRPGDWGADLVVGEGQCLGTRMQYGGPYLGILACREAFVRRLPGRLVGQTVDRRGRRCWVLTLQTREQHIRREKATSNICTNQGLFALRAAVYLALMGPQGMREVADACLQKSHYAAEKICQSPRFEMPWDGSFFKEFVIQDKENRVDELLSFATESGMLAGLPLGRWYPELQDCFLVAVTEQRTREEIDAWTNCLMQATV